MPTDFPAIVLSRTGTGLATIRCLALANVEVHAAIFSRYEPVNYSRLATKHILEPNTQTGERLIHWIVDYARRLGNRPMIFPTGDAETLLVAEYRDVLIDHCRVWNNSYDDLLKIVSKEHLYGCATNSGIDTIPSLFQPSQTELEAWVDANPGPYLVKPGYECSPGNSLGKKNLCLDNAPALLRWAAQADLRSLIIQRRLRGGDGNIFDCYGLCDSEGRIVTIATHRRWRQHLPDVGATSFGEIPAGEARIEALIIGQTRQLLSAIKYHGIFGIEWLYEPSSGKAYLIDFNARPFSTISHLADCGLNLPTLAVAEMAGENLSDIPFSPKLKHKLWIDFVRDSETFTLKQKNGELTLWAWLNSMLRCRSFAYWNWRDPGPAFYQVYILLQRLTRKSWRAAIALVQLIPLDM